MKLDTKALGLRIKEYRLKNELTQEKLAEMIGVGVSHISNLEVGNTTPSLSTFINLAIALHVSTDSLLCDSLRESQPTGNEKNLVIVEACDDFEARFLTELMKSSLQVYRNDRKRRINQENK